MPYCLRCQGYYADVPQSGRCTAVLVTAKNCEVCGAGARLYDRFCRKCGHPSFLVEAHNCGGTVMDLRPEADPCSKDLTVQ